MGIGKKGGVMMDVNKCTITVIHQGNKRTVTCPKGSNLMGVFHRKNIHVEAPCGGKGICGKCKVMVLKGPVSEIGHGESRFLSNNERARGYRLACMTKVFGDIDVVIDNHLDGAQIMSTGMEYSVDISPRIDKKFVQLDLPTVDDQRDDLKRLADSIGLRAPGIRIGLIRKLPDLLRDSDYKVTAAYDNNYLINVEKGDTTASMYGVSIDIGTTTVVCYLMDLKTGRLVDTISELNVQRIYGGDVISRIQHSMENEDGLARLRWGIVDQITGLINELADRNHIIMDHIYNVVIAGNTIMGHLFMGIDPQHIASTPFTPALTQQAVYPAHELGLKLGVSARIFMLPHISGYVGADVTAGILASGIDKEDDLSLIIDIGTNGEIVLGSSKKMVCCSTAAGPAFEGANIRHGMGGIRGAINTIRLNDGRLKYTTIGDEAPVGICGSGIVDALAFLLDTGLVDETGRLLDEDEIESETGKSLAHRFTEIDGQGAFVLVDAKSSSTGEPIVITQKDIREIQLAKAAISAGIKVLIHRMGKGMGDVTRLYLAGGFGSYIDKGNAAKIGLIPRELQNRIIAIGNGAGTGAMLSLLSAEQFKRADLIGNMAEYVELSSTPEFQDEYVNGMYFTT
ncbi:MAG TPA: ASKHA domain-containing protein [Clostridia bacterium]|nr:ASKHA domain-containing protein [Clostridia bacterium]